MKPIWNDLERDGVRGVKEFVEEKALSLRKAKVELLIGMSRKGLFIMEYVPL